uniref:Uncharacterized protein n=1 Tax=Junco hyemalis TaxID=40217 RepID=A0A8C5IQL0_JUNHY
MSRVPVGKVLLRNVIRHTGAHNKVGDRNVEDKGVGEADRRDLLEKAEQNAVRHLQVRYTTEMLIFSLTTPCKELRPQLEPDLSVLIEM